MAVGRGLRLMGHGPQALIAARLAGGGCVGQQVGGCSKTDTTRHTQRAGLQAQRDMHGWAGTHDFVCWASSTLI